MVSQFNHQLEAWFLNLLFPAMEVSGMKKTSPAINGNLLSHSAMICDEHTDYYFPFDESFDRSAQLTSRQMRRGETRDVLWSKHKLLI